VLIAALLLVGAILRPVIALTPEPISVAPQYARSAMTLYEVLEQPGYLVPVARRTLEAEVGPENSVTQLLAGPQAGPDLVGPFAPGTQLAGFEVSGGRVSVDLSPGALEGVDAGRAVDALVLTLTEFPEISIVSVAVAGVSLDASGSAVETARYLERPVLNPETPAATEGGTEIFFAYDGVDRYLVPITRASAPSEREPTTAMAQFLAGPLAGSGLEPVLPDDVGVIGIRVADGLATVNFDSHLVYAYRLSKANAMFVRRAVMATLTGLPGISAGLIEIDGSRLLLYTCVNVTQEFPQARPWAINDEYYLSSLPEPDPAAG
jgi:spore germination protein GerM